VQKNDSDTHVSCLPQSPNIPGRELMDPGLQVSEYTYVSLVVGGPHQVLQIKGICRQLFPRVKMPSLGPSTMDKTAEHWVGWSLTHLSRRTSCQSTVECPGSRASSTRCLVTTSEQPISRYTTTIIIIIIRPNRPYYTHRCDLLLPTE